MSEFRLFGEPEGGISSDHADLTNVTPDQHHPQLHKAAHVAGGADAFAAGDLLDASARVAVRKNSGAANVGARRRLNLIEGANVTLTVADDPANEEVDITVAAAAGADVSTLDKNPVTVTVANTTAESGLYGRTIPAGELGATGGLRLTIGGDYLNNTGASALLTLRVRFGATIVLVSNSFSIPPSPNTRKWWLSVWFLNAAANSQKWNASFLMSFASPNSLTVSNVAITEAAFLGAGQAASAEDTSLARDLAVTAQHGTAFPSISIRKEEAVLEKFP